MLSIPSHEDSVRNVDFASVSLYARRQNQDVNLNFLGWHEEGVDSERRTAASPQELST